MSIVTITLHPVWTSEVLPNLLSELLVCINYENLFTGHIFLPMSHRCAKKEKNKLKRPIMRVKECVLYWHTPLHSHIPHTLLHHALNQDCNNCISKIIPTRVIHDTYIHWCYENALVSYFWSMYSAGDCTFPQVWLCKG